MMLIPLTSRRRRFAALVFTGIVVGLAAGAWLRSDGPDAGGSAATVAVERRAFSNSVSAVGAVKPQIGAEVRVGSRVSGRLARLRANIGDRVERGEVIAELETDDVDAAVSQRRAEVRLAEARLAGLEALLPQELARAEADVARWEATADRASQDWLRQQRLLEQQVATRAEADAARELHEVAQAQLASARNTLALLRAGNVEQRRQAEAEVDRARAVLQASLVERSFAVLRAPISGIVASVSTQEGETVAAGLSAPTFVTILDLDRLQVDAYVDEVDIGKVEVGQQAVFTVDAYPAEDFQGRVAAIYPSATIQDNVVKYIVAIAIDGSGARLRPEMTASVRILLQAREVLSLPARAIRREAGRTVVHVVEAGRTEARPVRVGWRDGSWAEIVEGLREGERVLLDAPARGREEGGR